MAKHDQEQQSKAFAKQSGAFGQQSFAKGISKSVLGLHRRERSAFPAQIGKVRCSRGKAGGLGAAKHHTLQRKASKALHKGMDGSVFGPCRLERIAFLAKFREAGLAWVQKSRARAQ